jgi:HEAT repeat protein
MGRKGVTLAGRNAWLALLLLVLAVPVSAEQAEEQNQAALDVSRLIHEVRTLPDSPDRRDAARELSMIEPLPPEAIQALAEVLPTTMHNGAVERYAIQGLVKAGARAIPALTSVLDSKDPQAREAAVEALGRMAASEPKAWPILIGSFRPGDESVRRWSTAYQWGIAYQLAKVGPPVIPLLRKALTNSDPYIRAGAAATLAQLGNFDKTWSRNNPDTRREIVFASAADLAPAAPALAEALKDTDSNVQQQAAIALAYADPTDSRAVPILVDLLEKKDPILPDVAIAALENMGSAAKDADPALERALHNPNGVVGVGAARALANSAGAEACAPLAQAIADTKDGNVRAAAARAMVGLWPACPQTIPALIGTLGNREFSATNELAKLGKPAVPALTAVLKSPDLYVREDAVGALAQMKPLSPEAVDGLMLALKDVSFGVRSVAATALQNVGGEAAQAALAEQDREEKTYAQQSKPDLRRYRKQELIAMIPADADHKYPLTLAYLVPVYPRGGFAEQAEFLITLHTGKDRPERLVFWKKVGDDQYQQAKVIEPDDPDFAEKHFETPTVFFPKGQVPGEGVLCIDVPMDGYRSRTDQLFAIDRSELQPVEIESPPQWYKSKLGPQEQVWFLAANWFSNDKLEFAFNIWNADDAICCPTGGRVTGTYRLVKAFSLAGGAPILGLGPYSPSAPVIVRSRSTPTVTTATWKMVVDTAERKPMPRLTRLPHGNAAR